MKYLEEIKDLLYCIAVFDETESIETKGLYFEIIQKDVKTLIKKMNFIKETELEKVARLLKSEKDTLNTLIEKRKELDLLIKHQEENIKKLENSDDIIRYRILERINHITGRRDITDNAYGWLDDLDFIVIIMEVELEFGCDIDEGDTRIRDFKKISDLIDWLVLNVK